MLEQPRVANVGLGMFADTLHSVGAAVVRIEWQPPAGGSAELRAALEALDTPAVDAANRRAVERLQASQPWLIDVRPAAEVVPGLEPGVLLHAGPPIAWESMCGPMRGAAIGALLYEGLADSEQAASALAASGQIRFEPCHHHAAVGPMAGLVSGSMPVYVLEDRAHGTRAYATLNEGLGKVLRYGAYGAEVLDRLGWMRDQLGPALGAALRASGGVDVKALIAQAVQMGDECHNRNRAVSALLLRTLAPELAGLGLPIAELQAILRFMGGNEHFFLNVGMAACKLATDAAHGEPGSSLVTTMARNGVEFGIRLAGLPVDRWFTAPAELPVGLYFSGYGIEDGNPDIGDSAITETGGLGGFAMAGAPAIVQFIGGTPADALRYTSEMYEITLAESPAYRIPALDFRGTPAGIDARLVVETGLRPLINTGIAHREPGIGQVGAGLVRAPLACFEQAVLALAEIVDGVTESTDSFNPNPAAD